MSIFFFDIPLEENGSKDLSSALLRLEFGVEDEVFLWLTVVLFLVTLQLKLIKILISKYYLGYYIPIVTDIINMLEPKSQNFHSQVNLEAETVVQEKNVNTVAENNKTFTVRSRILVDFILLPTLAILCVIYSNNP